MIIGIGTDIVEIDRMRSVLSGVSAERFLSRVLTEEELALAEERKGRLVEFVAGRFAAKEAMSKALGCGIGAKLGFHDMSITSDEAGKPVCFLSEHSRSLTGCGSEAVLHLSITHSEHTAVAFAVIEK